MVFIGLMISPIDITIINIFNILKIGCWAVSHLHAASVGGRGVQGCNFTPVLASR
jgi:hypothetical protein